MKNLFLKLMAVALLLTISTAPAWAQTRVATVDLRKVFEGYWKTKQADAALKDRYADLSKEGQGLAEDLRKANEDYRKLLADANDQAVSAAEREKRQKAAEAKLKEIRDTQESLQQFDRQMQTTIAEQKRRMRDNILTEVRATINARAKSAGFSLVVDVTAESPNQTPIFLYTNGDNDLTETVLSQLNAGAPVDLEKPADKADPDKKPAATDKK